METDKDIKDTKTKPRCFFLLGPPTVLLSFGLALTATVLTDLIVYRTCLVSLNINATECLRLRDDAGSPEAMDLEAKVEPYASIVVMTLSLIESISPAVLSLFLGPWSDRGGRRPLFMAAFTGYTLTFAVLSLLCNLNISPWYLLFATMPAIIVGGLCTVTLATICYISDTTTGADRMMQLTWYEGSICCGEVVGILTGPLIYKNYGYTNVFITASICSALALVYIYFFIPETVENVTKESIRGLFKISSIKEIITSTFVKRDGFHRSIVWLGISSFTICAMIFKGQLTIEFLFTRVRLGWDVRDYSHYGVVGVLLRIVGLGGATLLGTVLGVPDTLLAVLGILSALGGTITKSLTWESWHMYLSVGIDMFSGLIGPVMRSTISKSVPSQDVGKVFSLTAFLEAFSPLGGAPLYTLIFSHYLPPIYPSPVFLLSTVIYLLIIPCIVFIDVQLKKCRKTTTYIAACQDDVES